MAQLIKIEAVMEQRWSLEEENKKNESGNEEGGSKDGPGKSQEERTLLSASC